MNSTRDKKTRRARVRRPAHSSTPRYFLYPNERTDYSRRRVQKLARTRSVPGRPHTPARLDSTRESVRSRDVSTIILDSHAFVDIVDSSRNLDDTSPMRDARRRNAFSTETMVFVQCLLDGRRHRRWTKKLGSDIRTRTPSARWNACASPKKSTV